MKWMNMKKNGDDCANKSKKLMLFIVKLRKAYVNNLLQNNSKWRNWEGVVPL